eukprot:TRINITY_DN9645_c0_g1_i1.p2 TRINITY_DN9645_c0_g1~~TRINITY_DN9645_c0_g1_i1.p2  ORF type:complete len:171 (+),score=12.88 TRINITY_DN9645_c0_g1_i1:104-616(+)
MASSQVSSSVGNRSLRMSDRKKDDQRRAKLKRNIMSLVVIRCMQGRVDLAQPTAEQLKDVENEVDARMDGGPVSDADVCQMAAALRRKLLQNAYRSESAPTPNTNALPKKNSLPPIENAPISPANLAVPDIASPAVWWELRVLHRVALGAVQTSPKCAVAAKGVGVAPPQ